MDDGARAPRRDLRAGTDHRVGFLIFLGRRISIGLPAAALSRRHFRDADIAFHARRAATS